MSNELKNGLVIKSNRVVEASYRLSLNEQRIILAAIVEARESQKGLLDGHITLEAKRFAQTFGVDEQNAYGQLKEAMDSLFGRFIVVRDIHPESGKDRVSKVHWISSASYIDGAGAVQLRFAPEMVPYITRLEAEFTSYRLEKIGKLTSAHAVRLYELLLQYKDIGSREIGLEWLKETLQIGEGYSGRTAIADFKKRVIDPSVKQINEHTDLSVTYENVKTGRTVSGLLFSISKKKVESAIKKKPGKSPKITREYIEKNNLAKPGESWDQTFRRLAEEHGQQKFNF